MAQQNKTLSYLTAYDLAMDQESFKRSFANHVEFTQGKDEYSASRLDFYAAAAQSTRDRMLDRWNKTQQSYYNQDLKRVYYLSLEFLIGRLLEDGLINLGMLKEARGALAELELDFDDIAEVEWDAGLGNGGLGRLAACFLDSMATHGLAAMGYGIRYEYGIFKQVIQNGAQLEQPDNWLRNGNPWEIARPEQLFMVRFFGRIQQSVSETGRLTHDWVETENVMAMAYDILIPGFRNEIVNTLRLWSAKATREFDFSYFNQGDYIQALQDKNATENISRVLYPNDLVDVGKELRLKQEYFFVSATLQDAVERHQKAHGDVSQLHKKAVFQLNDTHPAIAVPELMRILMDDRGMGWDEAWAVTTQCFAYTNHTILPEALEQWPVWLMERVLPRHMQIIYEINRRHLEHVRQRFPGDLGRLQRMSLIHEGVEKQVRMANLAVVGSFSVNGVSAMHSEILKTRLFRDFAEMMPEKFNNKTNGITPRRWLLKCNPGLSALITEHIGDGWIRNLERLEGLLQLAEDRQFQQRWREAKRGNKVRLADYVGRTCGFGLNPDSLFDVQVKRIHEYKRQLLNVLHVIALYREYRARPPREGVARTFLFSGKAAPGYYMAKLIIRLINAVADVVNRDPNVNQYLKVFFLPNYGISMAERIIPAADISEQISTAGTEASGTGNMKLSLNGALTVGTLDGANVEIREVVGPENFFLFGLNHDQIVEQRQQGYNPRAQAEANLELHEVLQSIDRGDFSPNDRGLFRPIVDALLHHGDPYFVIADFPSYREVHKAVAQTYRNTADWTRKSIVNVANMGRFSSDLTISRYAKEIWNAKGLKDG